jgi:PAS domain S-box-containing protein
VDFSFNEMGGEIDMKNRSWKILLVEDDEDDYILTRSLLEEAISGDFQLTWVSTSGAALEALQEELPDVLLVDYRLGSENGLDLVRETVSRNCKVPIIVLTGQGSYDVDLEAMKVGATDYLSKGEVTPTLLERTIRYAIERIQSQEALQRAKDELEMRVQERTQELAQANEVLRDEIAERLRAESAVRESEARFRKLAETTSTAIFIVQEMSIRYANTAARMITGYHPEELVGKDFWEIAHPSYRGTLKKHGLTGPWGGLWSEQMAAEVPTRYELKLLTKDGRERWADITAGSFEYGGSPALVVTAFDITERDLAEQALRNAKSELESRVAERTIELENANEQLEEINTLLFHTNEQLHNELAERKRAAEEIIRNAAQIEVQRRLIQYRELERLLIAQDLHDGTLQDLIAMSFLLKDIHHTAEERLAVSTGEISSSQAYPNSWQGKLGKLQQLLDEQIDQLRTFCSELRPPTLAPYGLEKAIEAHAETFQEKHAELHISLDLMHDGQRLPEGTRLALFRIYQELLNNVVRHAQASNVWVHFQLDGTLSELQVKDNGQGFSVPENWVEVARQGHLGLVGIQERAEAVGGKVMIQSTPGGGTLVQVIVPLQEDTYPGPTGAPTGQGG